MYHGKTDFIGVNTHDKLEVKRKDKEAILPANPADIFPEYYLIRVNEFNKHAVTPLEEWIEFLKTDKIADDAKALGLLEARKKLTYYAMNKEEKQAYDEHINAVMIQNDVLSTANLEGKIEGRIEGKMEGSIEVAKRMLADGMPIEVVLKYTGLTQAEISAHL